VDFQPPSHNLLNFFPLPLLPMWMSAKPLRD
jgi:hypothetical protein